MAPARDKRPPSRRGLGTGSLRQKPGSQGRWSQVLPRKSCDPAVWSIFNIGLAVFAAKMRRPRYAELTAAKHRRREAQGRPEPGPGASGGSFWVCAALEKHPAIAYSWRMSHRDLIENALALPAAERLEIIAALWDSIGEEHTPLTPAQAAEIDRRLASFEADKADVMTWEEFKAELEERAQ